MANDPIVLLTIGFLLTSVLGGGLAYFFQQRGWRHQYEIQRRDLHRQQALKTFEEVSSLLDQRLYRMRLISWSAKRLARSPLNSGALDVELADYRAVLRVWNDNLNRNLALVDTYFGRDARVRLEVELFAEYAAIGEELDQFVREVAAAGGTPVRVRLVGGRLDDLSDRVYQFNVSMLRSLGDDGRHLAETEGGRDAEPRGRLLRFGHHGDDVGSLQHTLVRSGLLLSAEDGHFGQETEAAVREFQRSHGLRDDGVVGPRTAEALAADGAV